MPHLIENLSDLVLRHAPAGIAVLEGEELRFRYTNAAYRQMAALTREVSGERFEAVFPRIQAEIPRLLRRVLATGQPEQLREIETWAVVTPAGAPTYWNADYVALDADGDGRADAVAMLVQNVTEQVLARRDAEIQARAARSRAEAETRARQALAESEDRFRATFENAAVGIAHVGLDGRWLRVNERLAAILGYSREELLQLTFQDITHPDDLAADEARAAQLFGGDIANYQMDKRYIRKDGSIVWAQLTGALMRNDHGEPVCAIAIVQDISARRAAEQALQEAEQRLRLAVAAAPVTLFTRDAELRLTWVYNPRDEARGRYLGTLPEDVLSPDDAAVVNRLYHRALASGEPVEQLLRVRPALSDADWSHICIHPVHDERGSVTGLACAAYDVTELMEARGRLAEREATLRLALEAAHMGEWHWELEEDQVQHSPGLLRVYGLPPQTPIIRGRDFFEQLHPEDRAAVEQRVARALQSADEFLHHDFRILGAEGEVRWIASRSRIERDEAGRARAMTGVDMDVTAERRLRAQLEQSNQALERFARTVAHDLKAPLQTIANYAGLVQRRAAERLEAAELRSLDTIQGSTRQMADLVDGILEYARASQTEAPRRPVDLETALQRVLQRLDSAIVSSGATVHAGPLPQVIGNELLLTQVLQNLIGNALKFRGSEPLRIDLQAERHPDEWHIHIRDNGLGIPAERQQHLFDAFEQAHPEDGYGGVGLGLSLVRDAVHYHGGRVWLDSAPGAGSTFSFSLSAPEPSGESGSH